MVEGRDVGGSYPRGPHSSARSPEAIAHFKSSAIGAMGLHQRQSPKRAQDISDHGHPTQIQGFPINPGLIFGPNLSERHN